MKKNISSSGAKDEKLFSKVYPQRPKDHEERYQDIPDYSGFCPNCPECGQTMGYSYLKSKFKCPDCGYIMEESDWDYQASATDGMPWTCQVCGGPWPQCQSSCKLFDN